MKQNDFVLPATDRLCLDMSQGVCEHIAGPGSAIEKDAIYGAMNFNKYILVT